MKLKNLIQAYNYNNIQAEVKEKIEDKNERAGVIEFKNNIYASYLLDKEDIVSAFSIFCNCLTDGISIEMLLKNATDIINIMQKTIEILDNITQEEANIILDKLNIFLGKIEKKSFKALNYIYHVEIIGEMLKFSAISVNTSG